MRKEELAIIFDELINQMETNRIDVDAETSYCDPAGILRAKYERANRMLDECIQTVKGYYETYR